MDYVKRRPAFYRKYTNKTKIRYESHKFTPPCIQYITYTPFQYMNGHHEKLKFDCISAGYVVALRISNWIVELMKFLVSFKF